MPSEKFCLEAVIDIEETSPGAIPVTVSGSLPLAAVPILTVPDPAVTIAFCQT